MKAKRIILFFLLLSTLIPQAWAADFGEDDEYLGQVVDDYETDDNVSAVYNVIHNETLDCMELNYFVGGEGDYFLNFSSIDNEYYFEAFPTGWLRYTGGGGVIEKSNIHVFNGSWSLRCYDPNTASYGYGYRAMVEQTGDYVFKFNIWIMSDIQPDNLQIMGLYDVGVGYSVNPNLDYHDGGYYIVNRFGASDWEDVKEVDSGEWIEVCGYMNKTSGKVIYYVNGENMGDFSLWGNTNPDRIYVGDGSAAVGKGYFFMDDLLIGKGNFIILEGYESGYYYTVEMLEGDIALTVLYNVTIPEGTAVTMEFSKDNNTWVDHNDVAGHDVLTEGHEALDLRDLNTTSLYQRVNMTSDGPNTPRFLQNRIVTTTDQPTVGDGDADSLFPGLAIGIAILIIAYAYSETRR